jgi:hypothetical protein
MKRLALLVSLMMIASAGTALAWGPNDPSDTKADPDGDRLGNLLEFRLGTNPMNPDSDGGGCWDGWEHQYGLDPAWAVDDLFDSDNDGWTNFREFLEGTDPLDPNTDDDKFQLDSTDPHPLIPDGVLPPTGPGVGPGEVPWLPPNIPVVPNPGPPIPGPHLPFPGPLPPGPVPPDPLPDDGDQDHDGLVEFIESI